MIVTVNDDRMPDRLEVMLEHQLYLEVETYGVDVPNLTDEQRQVFIKDMTLALTDELHEALAETRWKPWAQGDGIVSVDRYLGELTDAFHFFMCLWLAGGGTAEQLFRMYQLKAKVNLQRQLDGYDMHKTKCPACGTAYDDAASACTTGETTGRLPYCGNQGQYVHTDGSAA